jgi:hypothetical protein
VWTGASIPDGVILRAGRPTRQRDDHPAGPKDLAFARPTFATAATLVAG